MSARNTPRVLVLMLTALAALPSCGEHTAEAADPRTASGWSLLARRPDGVLHQPGVLEASVETQWGELGTSDWMDATSLDAENRPFMWSRRKTGRVILPAGSERDRHLGLTLWCPPAPEGEEPEEEVTIRLNGVVVGTARVGPAPVELGLETPAAVWQRGDNLLALEVEHLRPLPGSDTPRGIALQRVVYDEPAELEVDLQAGALVLAGDTEARYRVEDLDGLGLRVAGQSTGGGRLLYSVERIDPSTGQTGDVLQSLDMTLGTEELDRWLPLPDSERGVLEVCLRWEAEAGSVLRLRELRIVEKAPREPFPIILLAVDTLSARHMSVYGYERDTTPHLAELARDATVFEHCVTNATWTVPSFMSIMSGLYGEASRIGNDGGDAKLWEVWCLADNRWTLAEAMRAAGYRTAGVVDSTWLTKSFKFTQGFDHYDTSSSELNHLDTQGGMVNVARLALEQLGGDRPALEQLEGAPPALEQLGGPADGRPPFLFLHCFDVHGPYKADAAFHGRFSGAGELDTSDLRRTGGITNAYNSIPWYITEAEFGPDALPEEVSASLIKARYDEGLAMTDAAIGAFFDELKARGIYDRALIAVFADHGETDGDGPFLFGHGVLSEEVVHVPLIVKLPGNEGAGQRVAQSVQLVDLYPTITELAGIRPRAGGHGRSLVPALRGAALEPRPILTETGIMQQASLQHDGWKLNMTVPGFASTDVVLLTHPAVPASYLEQKFPTLAGRTMTDKVLAELRAEPGYTERIQALRKIATRPFFELYRLDTDPEERDNLCAREPEVLARMQMLLLEELKRRVAAHDLALPPATAPHLSAEDEEELRKLGYIDDGG
jgi:arylsulfatase A-like enzyme